MAPRRVPSPLDFFHHLVWIDGKPLADVIEPYRAQILTDVLYAFDDGGNPKYNLALIGRAKKNWKTTDLVLACFYRFFTSKSPQGNDCFILANDEGQAADDLKLAKKLIEANPILKHEVEVRSKEIIRMDGQGTLSILPARDVTRSHGKTYLFIGFDEIHGYRNWDLFEALAPDPTRPDALTWITSYASIYNTAGAPLHDIILAGKTGDDPRMYFSWYAGVFCPDPTFAGLPIPEERANPSMPSWENHDYLDQQRRRLPTAKYRRLHLNLPGAPDGAFLDAGKVVDCIVPGRRFLPPQEKTRYHAFVDMSGGSSDDACLAIAHKDENGRIILDILARQAGKPPFNPRTAVKKFAAICRSYRVHRVTGDSYAGETFKQDFEEHGITYRKCGKSKSDLYESLEPIINAGGVELLSLPELESQLLTLVVKGTRVDHQPGDHDDWANACAGAVWLASEKSKTPDPAAVLALMEMNSDLNQSAHWNVPGDPGLTTSNPFRKTRW